MKDGEERGSVSVFMGEEEGHVWEKREGCILGEDAEGITHEEGAS
jgi:hypothetical protein